MAAGGVHVRDAAPGDLAALERALPGDHARQLANAAAGRRDLLVAWCDGEPAGTVVVRWTGVPVHGVGAVAEIGSLAVVPARRGHGIGSLLVAAAEQRVRSRGGRAAAMHVAEENDGARRLYARLGYREAGRRPRADGGADLVLVRALGTEPAPG